VDYAVGAGEADQRAWRGGKPHLCHSCDKGGICKHALRYTWDCSLYRDRRGRLQAHAVRNTGNYEQSV
jgi:hypothetical protein